MKHFIRLIFTSYCLITINSLSGQSNSFVEKPKYDTVRIDGKYIGVIEIVNIDSAQGSVYDPANGNYRGQMIKKVTYNMYLDDYATRDDINRIKGYYSKTPFQETKIIFIDRFLESKTSGQLAGIKLQQAGILMNQRNNWRIFGGLFTGVIAVAGAGTGIGIAGSVVLGLTTVVISTVKDYQANSLLQEAGLLLQDSKTILRN
jgi:hypothetical protein